MSSKKLCCICVLFSLFAGCASESSISERKKKAQVAQSDINKDIPQQLADKDLFGNEATLTVSEEGIQVAPDRGEFRVPLSSPVISAQPGNRAPETIMQEGMQRCYTVSIFSGVLDRQKPLTYNKNRDKNKSGGVISAGNMNWMQVLRFVAAKGHQRTIVIYQDMSQIGKHDSVLKSTVWSNCKNDKLIDAISLCYLVCLTLVDVAAGEWATRSSVNHEYKVLPLLSDKNEASTTGMTEQQIMQLK